MLVLTAIIMGLVWRKKMIEKKIGLKKQSSRRKILMFTWEFPPNVVGGLSSHVYGLSRELVMLGIEVYVVTAYKDNILEEEIMNGVFVYRVKPLNERDESFLSWIGGLNLSMAMKGIELAEKIKFDLVHVHDWLSGACGIALKECLSVPLLTTIHATEHGRNGGIYNEMQRFIHEKEKQLTLESDQLIVCSEYMLKEILSLFNIGQEKMVIIPNGIEPNVNFVHSKMLFPEWKGKSIIFSIGRMVQEKGFETMIQAASLVKKQELNLHFIVAGKGPMLERYRSRIKREDLEEQISFIGYISEEEKNAYLLQSEMTVFPSLYEPFGIVALESMNLGRPTIVSNIGGLRGIVQHMKTGLLIVPGDAENLLEQINYLLLNPQKAKEIGSKGKQMVERYYGWKHIAIQTKQRMEDVLELNR